MSARHRKIIKRPQLKLRLIRRYIREKAKVDPKSNEKQSSFPDIHAPGKIGKPITKLGKPFYRHHDVVTDKKPIKQPAEINSIPLPIPDTGSGPVPPGPIAAGSPLLGAIRDTSTVGLIIPPTPPPPRPFSKSLPGSFSALPPLPSLIPTVTSAILIDSPFPSTAIETGLPKSPNVNPQTSASKAHSVSLAVIILLAVGSALLLLGSCVVIKICTRTRRKDLPKPSLPIFEDADPEDNFFEAKESPIFGGKERLSPMPGPNGAGGPGWTWIQYPHDRFALSAVGTQTNSSGEPRTGWNAIRPEVGHTPTDGPKESSLSVPTSSHHTPKRQSMGATSIYSPRSGAYIAQAITHDRLATANGDEILTKSKTSPKRRSQLVRDEKQRHRDSAVSIIGLAYDGEYAASPSIVEYTPVIGHREGRERTKSSYLSPTSSYPTAPNMHGTAYSIATATRVNVGQRNSFSKDKFSLRNSNSRWKRDTQALTYALGLATPEVQSPHPTLYPEDSMSVADMRTQRKRHSTDRRPPASVPDIPVIIPDDSLSQRSGLMNMDFRVSQMSLSELTMEDGGSPPTEAAEPALANDSLMPGASSRHAADIPPRVPSPPPLPSLSQMALAQRNQEAYANYHSPTYSLYGLYESPDRRSIKR